jgi:hypothetical protein
MPMKKFALLAAMLLSAWAGASAETLKQVEGAFADRASANHVRLIYSMRGSRFVGETKVPSAFFASIDSRFEHDDVIIAEGELAVKGSATIDRSPQGFRVESKDPVIDMESNQVKYVNNLVLFGRDFQLGFSCRYNCDPDKPRLDTGIVFASRDPSTVHRHAFLGSSFLNELLMAALDLGPATKLYGFAVTGFEEKNGKLHVSLTNHAEDGITVTSGEMSNPWQIVLEYDEYGLCRRVVAKEGRDVMAEIDVLEVSKGQKTSIPSRVRYRQFSHSKRLKGVPIRDELITLVSVAEAVPFEIPKMTGVTVADYRLGEPNQSPSRQNPDFRPRVYEFEGRLPTLDELRNIKDSTDSELPDDGNRLVMMGTWLLAGAVVTLGGYFVWSGFRKRRG